MIPSDAFPAWLFDAALPLWWEQGADRVGGGFHEALALDGTAPAVPRRARVQGRQSFVFAEAARLGWTGPWREAAGHGLDYLNRRYRRPDGLFSTLVDANGAVVDRTAMTYDQAFALLAAAALYRLEPDPAHKSFALTLLASVEKARRHPQGGFAEAGAEAFLSNPHMHLLEAALAWAEVDGDPAWSGLADEIAALALSRFLDPGSRMLKEYFAADWQAAAGEKGAVVEPGHQFEWAWLLERWARRKGDGRAHRAATMLFEAGTRGVDPIRKAAIDEMDDSGAPRRITARLWPQTERLKAALILRDGARGADRLAYEAQAQEAAQTLGRYLETPLKGLWRDKMLPDGSFVEEPAPASSLYHIICAVASLMAG